MSSTRGQNIASITHCLVVEPSSYINKDRIRWLGCKLAWQQI